MPDVIAIAGAVQSFFNFLSTTQGQQVLADIRAVNQAVNADVAKMISFLGANAASRTPVAPPPVPATPAVTK